jgi:hypothetical protein
MLVQTQDIPACRQGVTLENPIPEAIDTIIATDVHGSFMHCGYALQ